MALTFFTILFGLGVFTQLSIAQGNSMVFSQFAGAPTVTAAFSGTGASEQSTYFTICTNYLHGLQAIDLPLSSVSPQLEQVQADGVCQFCTSVDLSRVDSCCAAPTSVACFGQFAAGATPTTGTAAATATATPAATSAGAPASTKASNGNRFGPMKVTIAASVLIAMLGFVGWSL